MAARKMIPPGGLKPPKNPPPPKALQALEAANDLHEELWAVGVLKDGVMLRFTQETEFVLMSARGARLMANELLARAQELEEMEHPNAG